MPIRKRPPTDHPVDGQSPPQSLWRTTQRKGSAVLFIGGLIVCGVTLLQPTELPLTVVLTDGSCGTTSSSGGSSGTTSGGTVTVAAAMGDCSPFSFVANLISGTLTFLAGLFSTLLGLFGLTSRAGRRGRGWFV
ncbi:MAG: hypothetical protein QOH07_1837 [Mycobacterium sp.]|nr:hypothetical protein [Mycobacterium sp.]